MEAPRRRRYPEVELYRQVAHYLNIKYPHAIYHFDLSGVNNQSRATRGIYKSLNGRSWPDLFIAYPAGYGGVELVDRRSGLFLELKAEGVRLKKRDGSWASEHIAEQAETLTRLQAEGYIAQFAVGFTEAQTIIDSYMGARR